MSFRRVAVLLLAVSCTGESDDDDGPADTGVMEASSDAGGDPAAEVGTGREEFEALTAGQTVDLTQGTQAGPMPRFGGFHIWGSARAKGIDPEDVLVEIVLRESNGTEQARQARMITLQPSGEWHVVYGFAPRITDCCALAGKGVIMEVRAEDRAGKVVTDDIMVMAGPCIDGNTSTNQCP